MIYNYFFSSYHRKLMVIFILLTASLLLLSVVFNVFPIEISITIISILATVIIALFSHRDFLTSKKLKEAGFEFCADDIEYLNAAIKLIGSAKRIVLSLLSTWYVEKEILTVLEKCEAKRIVFMGPIDKGERFPNAIDRIRNTIEINKKRKLSGKREIEVYPRESSGIKFVVADENVLINSKPLRASNQRTTSGFVIKDSINGTHYNTDLCESCKYYPCQEGLYCLVVTPSLTVSRVDWVSLITKNVQMLTR